ncbi:dna replication-related element factor isoform a [Holotrichia oblita]|uniref:Dna replication-related element factor isoform a n=1 Tax=Holotrichia oblita TaxID=644536 RepID=A0ACB9TLG6_HOLOL|nr:dna replication-related element factor isoform a [Holotrichia oblita]
MTRNTQIGNKPNLPKPTPMDWSSYSGLSRNTIQPNRHPVPINNQPQYRVQELFYQEDPYQDEAAALDYNYSPRGLHTDATAMCNICKQTLSYKSTSNNLRKHMSRKHPLVNIDIQKSQHSVQKRSIITSELVEPSTSLMLNKNALEATNKISQQSTVTAFLRKKLKLNIQDKKNIDDSLLLLFTRDFQPFSVVDDYGFKKFVSTLNQSYELPSRKTISKSLLPTTYEEVYNKTKVKMTEVKAITLTTDCWTSCNTENFLAVTGHFINKNFKMENILLECTTFEDSHTSENLGKELKRII